MSKHRKTDIKEESLDGSSSKRNATIILSIAVLIILGIIFIGGSKGSVASTEQVVPSKENVTMIDGKQIIEFKAKGGYTPRASRALAGVPTILRFNTNGTFDCSASVRIPSLNISKILPNSGTTDIDLGTPTKGPIQGTCGMGMYPFSIEFKD